ncbi:MAG TPA: MASE3 domain-containing protein, partial [Anaeromyxobacteraceae bacterium]|nr:MASE3 domain-containing protein [Anaeromyxobacteraceae bacterium]
AGTQGFEDARARLVGMAALGVAALEALHLLLTPGITWRLPGASPDRALWPWLSARLLGVAALLAAAAVRRGRRAPALGRGPLLAGAVALAAALAGAGWLLPDDGRLFSGDGFTTAYRAAEWTLTGLAGAGAVLHLRAARQGDDRASLRFAAALALAALSGAAFALRGGSAGGLGALGHVYQAGAAWLVFAACFAAAVVHPYEKLDALLADLAANHAEVSRLQRLAVQELGAVSGRPEPAGGRREPASAWLEAEEAVEAVVPAGLALLGPEGELVRLSPAAEALLGFPEAVRGWPLEARWKSLKPETADGRPIPVEASPLARALAGETVAGELVVLNPPQRRPLAVRLGAAPVRGPDGRPRGAALSILDVSDGEDLRARHAELLHTLSHDLRNCLQVTMLQAERLLKLVDGAERPRERKAVETIVAGTREMGVLIRDLVDSARLEMGLGGLERQALDLRDFAAEVLARPGLEPVGRVKLAVPEGLPRVHADPVRLERILRNLVSAFAKLGGDPAAEIGLVAGAAYGEVVVSLRDRGPAPSPEEVQALFQRAWRGREGQRGEGLALYVARLLVEAHGGRIWAEATPEGTAITFTLQPAA